MKFIIHNSKLTIWIAWASAMSITWRLRQSMPADLFEEMKMAA
jgi:hypothetical protein